MRYDTVEIDKPALEAQGLAHANKPFRQRFHADNTNRLLPYDASEVMRMKRNYYGMITFIDQQVGRLLAYLEKNHLRENTIIIFTSDHGDYMGDHHMITKSPAMYDCLIRVPLIISWPQSISENIVYDDVVSQVDIMPTLCDLVSIEIPDQVQGKSFAGILRGDTQETVREYVFAEYGLPGREPIKSFEEINDLMPDYEQNPVEYAPGIPWEGNPISLAGTFRMVRSKNWKLVQERMGTSELYNLVNDPHELTNIYGHSEYSEVQNTLREALEIWESQQAENISSTPELAQENLDSYLKYRREGKSPGSMY